MNKQYRMNPKWDGTFDIVDTGDLRIVVTLSNCTETAAGMVEEAMNASHRQSVPVRN